MPYNSNELIASAYYASGVVSREFETVSGTQFIDGLQWLNDILADKRIDGGMIPYETTYSFPLRAGIEKYYIPNLVQIDTIVFYLNSVRFQLKYTKRNQYFGSSRVEGINSLPYCWYFERQTGGGNLYIYFSPDKDYPLEIHGTFNLNSVTAFEDLSLDTVTVDLGVPTFYGTGELVTGQLVVNEVDLQGIYPSIGALANYINSGIIPGVTASLNVNNFALSSSLQPPTPIYVRTNGLSPGGARFIGPVQAATTGNLVSTYSNGVTGIGATLTNAGPFAALVVDGYAVVLGDRILVKDQSNVLENGSYTVNNVGSGATNWILTRTTNYDQPIEIRQNDLFTVFNGTVNGNLTYRQTAQVVEVGVSDISFLIFNALTFSNFSTISNPLYKIFNASGFDQFYITYLRYALADRICAEYNYAVPANVTAQLDKYRAWINKKSRLLDLRMEKVSTLQTKGVSVWGWANLGRGFLP